MKPFSIFILEDQPIALLGLQRALKDDPACIVLGSAADLPSAIQSLKTSAANLLLISLPALGKSALELLGKAAASELETAIVLWVASYTDADAVRALQLGVKGIIRKTAPPDVLLRCLHSVAAGEKWVESAAARARAAGPYPCKLSPREREIVALVQKGLRNRQIADQLQIAEGTVKVHLLHIFEKAGVGDRFQLALNASRILGGEQQE